MATTVKREEILEGLKSQIEGHREDGGKLVVKIGKCTFYSTSSSPKYATFADFVKAIVHKHVDAHDASCFEGKYGILYSWLYLVDPAYVDRISGPKSVYGELAVRLGLLVLEYNVYAGTPLKQRTPEMREYFKYTDFAVKRVCVQTIHELVVAQSGRVVDDNDISNVYELFPQIRKSLPFTILIALANKFMPDTDTVKVFSAKFAEIINFDASAKQLMPSFRELGVAIAEYMIAKYGIVELVQAIPAIAADPEIKFVTKRLKRTVRAKAVRLDTTEEFFVKPARHLAATTTTTTTTTTTAVAVVAVARRRTDVMFISKKSKEDPGVRREAISACSVCDSMNPPETGTLLTEGRIAGKSDAAVDYETLESTTWRKMGPIGAPGNFARIVGFIHEVLSPMRSIQASSVQNLAFTLLSSDGYERHARDVILSFICGVEFINLNFRTLEYKTDKTVKDAMDKLVEKKPLFADRTHRVLFARLLLQQLFKQLIDADECESRAWSDAYKQRYGMIAHIVGSISYVQQNLVKLFELDPAGKASITNDLVKRVNRRFFDLLYAARLTCDSKSVIAWQQWKEEFFGDYAAIHAMIIERLTDPSKNTGDFPGEPRAAVGSVKTKVVSEKMKELLKRAEGMLSVPVKTLDRVKHGFVTWTPDFDEPSPMGNLPQIGEDDEKEQEERILAALDDVNDSIDNERSTHRKRELREAITAVKINRSFLRKDFSYADISIGHLDYSYGQFGGGEIRDLQAFLSKQYAEQQPRKDDPMNL